MTGKKDPLLKGERVELQYGLYQSIGGEVGASFKAVAYVGRRRVAESSGEAADSTISSLKSYLDIRSANHRQGRKEGVPTAAEFRDALASLRPDVPLPVMELLTTHSKLPGEAATLSQLAKISLGCTPSAVEIEYLRIGRKLSKLLEFSPETNGISGQLATMFVLATPQKSAREDAWKLRRELCEALAELDGKPRANKGDERPCELAAESKV